MGNHRMQSVSMKSNVVCALLLLGVCVVIVDGYSSGYSSGTSKGSDSDTSKGSGTSKEDKSSGSGTSTSTDVATITQTISLDLLASEYVGQVMTIMNTAVGIAYKLYVNKNWLTGCSVTSAVSSRRAISVKFTSKMPKAKAATANTASKAMTKDSLVVAATQAKTDLGSAYSNVTVPTVVTIATPSCSGAGCSGSFSGVISAVSFSVLTLAALPIAAMLHK